MVAPARAAEQAMMSQSGRSGARAAGVSSVGASRAAQGMARNAAVAGATYATAATGFMDAPLCCSSTCAAHAQQYLNKSTLLSDVYTLRLSRCRT